MIRFSIDSALTYKCTETTVDDWQDTSENTAKLILELQGHAKAVANHLADSSTSELTSSLRKYTETRLEKSEENLEEHKSDTDGQFSIIFRSNEEL